MIMECLRCPKCKGELWKEGGWEIGEFVLVCRKCKAGYKYIDGIPDLYIDKCSSKISKQVEEANEEVYDTRIEDFKKNVIRKSDEFYRYEKETFQILANQHGNENLLEVGCATGKILEFAKPFYKNLFGIDLSTNILKEAKKITDNVYRASAYALPFEDNYFDCATCHSTLHHLVEHYTFFREVFRVLKPGGVFYSDTDPNKAFVDRFKWWLDIRRKLKGRIFNIDKKIEDLSDYHKETGLYPNNMAERLHDAGFYNIKKRYRFPPNPDEFTQLVEELSLCTLKNVNSLYYYFVLIAQKRIK